MEPAPAPDVRRKRMPIRAWIFAASFALLGFIVGASMDGPSGRIPFALLFAAIFAVPGALIGGFADILSVLHGRSPAKGVPVWLLASLFAFAGLCVGASVQAPRDRVQAALTFAAIFAVPGVLLGGLREIVSGLESRPKESEPAVFEQDLMATSIAQQKEMIVLLRRLVGDRDDAIQVRRG